MKSLIILSAVVLLVGFVRSAPDGDLRESREDYDDDEVKRPYSFAYSASRHYNGDPDREHKEERGADGVTRGVYRFVDPRHQIQEVVYHSDATGFHVDASTNLPRDTPVVSAAKLRHQQLYEQIQREHLRIAEERRLIKDSDEDDIYDK